MLLAYLFTGVLAAIMCCLVYIGRSDEDDDIYG